MNAIEVYTGENFNPEKVEILNDNGKRKIVKWEYDIEQPTIEQLEALQPKVELIAEQEAIIRQSKNTMEYVWNDGTYDILGTFVAQVRIKAENTIEELKNGN